MGAGGGRSGSTAWVQRRPRRPTPGETRRALDALLTPPSAGGSFAWCSTTWRTPTSSSTCGCRMDEGRSDELPPGEAIAEAKPLARPRIRGPAAPSDHHAPGRPSCGCGGARPGGPSPGRSRALRADTQSRRRREAPGAVRLRRRRGPRADRRGPGRSLPNRQRRTRTTKTTRTYRLRMAADQLSSMNNAAGPARRRCDRLKIAYQAAAFASFRRDRIIAPRPAKPTIIIAQGGGFRTLAATAGGRGADHVPIDRLVSRPGCCSRSHSCRCRGCGPCRGSLKWSAPISNDTIGWTASRRTR